MTCTRARLSVVLFADISFTIPLTMFQQFTVLVRDDTDVEGSLREAENIQGFRRLLRKVSLMFDRLGRV